MWKISMGWRSTCFHISEQQSICCIEQFVIIRVFLLTVHLQPSCQCIRIKVVHSFYMLRSCGQCSRACGLWVEDILSFSFWFFMKFNSLDNFGEGPPQEHSCEVWWKLVKWLRRRYHLSKLLTTDGGHSAIIIAHIELKLRWAKNK